MSEKVSEALGSVVQSFTWLLTDAFFLLILLASLVSYGDLDEQGQRLVRGFFVFTIGYMWISGLHLLAYVRCADAESGMPAWKSYGCYTLKGLLFGAFVFWSAERVLL